MSKLKPCPFCGGKAELTTDVTAERYSKPRAMIYCTNCKIETRWFDDKNRDGTFVEEAVNAWNKRCTNEID